MRLWRVVLVPPPMDRDEMRLVVEVDEPRQL